jgi:hypothetical protein
MIKETKFVHSHHGYAVYRAGGQVMIPSLGRYSVDAVWYRGRASTPYVVFGELTGYHGVPGMTIPEWLTNHTDGRYGGDALVRWDGDNLWAPTADYSVAASILDTLLRPMLDQYPMVPEGFDGWWTFADDPTRTRK